MSYYPYTGNVCGDCVDFRACKKEFGIDKTERACKDHKKKGY